MSQIKKSYFLPDADEIIHIAENQARKKRISESKDKMIFVADNIVERLEKALDSIPLQSKLSKFEEELINLTLKENIVKNMRFSLLQIIRIITGLKRKGVGKAGVKGDKKETKEFFGRLYSMTKKLDKTIKQYNALQKQLSELPAIKEDKFSVILAGIPNAGKTTLLKRLSGSKAKIASYAFTTTSINLGFIKTNYDEIQLIDAPGLLEKQAGKETNIEKKTKAALTHLSAAVLFVVDPSKNSGNSISSQKRLLDGLKKEFSEKQFIVVINKDDLVSKEELEKIGKEFDSTLFDGEKRQGKELFGALYECFKKSLKEQLVRS